MKNYNIKDYRKERWEGYKDYHCKMMLIGDCDPAYPALRYVADRFELNKEQRYWLAFLYSLSYCVATTYFMCNEFPDYENVDLRRVENWWKINKSKTLFQTDRAKVKNFNLITKIMKSYQDLLNGQSQSYTFERKLCYDKQKNYDKIYEFASGIYYFGRFSLFLYLETLNALTDLPIEPTILNFKEAESCRNGLIYAMGKENDLATMHHKPSRKKLTPEVYDILQKTLVKLQMELLHENPDLPINLWNIETSLCAYKKLFWQSRYLGYYIDRMQEEINFMEQKVTTGVDWSVLWDFRKEYFDHTWLGELNSWNRIQKPKMETVINTGNIIGKSLHNYNIPNEYKREVYFRGKNKAYESFN
jgi:hypothetical protein